MIMIRIMNMITRIMLDEYDDNNDDNDDECKIKI